jgi:hypothetical protein
LAAEQQWPMFNPSTNKVTFQLGLKTTSVNGELWHASYAMVPKKTLAIAPRISFGSSVLMTTKVIPIINTKTMQKIKLVKLKMLLTD